ncbi:hypothetical protein [Evansella clarkii]|uniref:hypothetical protein n=1 Tax=Evansella clarkii TaxID=79879 RepID=UPI000B43C78E|nr:hypothetical protein [Evansella clarkii]
MEEVFRLDVKTEINNEKDKPYDVNFLLTYEHAAVEECFTKDADLFENWKFTAEKRKSTGASSVKFTYDENASPFSDNGLSELLLYKSWRLSFESKETAEEAAHRGKQELEDYLQLIWDSLKLRLAEELA